MPRKGTLGYRASTTTPPVILLDYTLRTYITKPKSACHLWTIGKLQGSLRSSTSRALMSCRCCAAAAPLRPAIQLVEKTSRRRGPLPHCRGNLLVVPESCLGFWRRQRAAAVRCLTVATVCLKCPKAASCCPQPPWLLPGSVSGSWREVLTAGGPLKPQSKYLSHMCTLAAHSR